MIPAATSTNSTSTLGISCFPLRNHSLELFFGRREEDVVVVYGLSRDVLGVEQMPVEMRIDRTHRARDHALLESLLALCDPNLVFPALEKLQQF